MENYVVASAFLLMVFAPAVVSVGSAERKKRRAAGASDLQSLPQPPAARHRRSVAIGHSASAVRVIHAEVAQPAPVPLPPQEPVAVAADASDAQTAPNQPQPPLYVQSHPVLPGAPHAEQPDEPTLRATQQMPLPSRMPEPEPQPRAWPRVPLQYGEPERMSAPRAYGRPAVRPQPAAQPAPQQHHAAPVYAHPMPMPYAAMAAPYWQPPMPFAYPPAFGYAPPAHAYPTHAPAYPPYGFWPHPPVAAPVPAPVQAQPCPHCAAVPQQESVPDFRRAVYDAAAVAPQDRLHRSQARR